MAQEAEREDQNDSATETTLLTEDDVRTSPLGELTVTGFSVMCAWHFLTLFTATPATGEAIAGGRPFILQFVLYLAFALSYGVLAFASKPLLKTLYRRGKRWSVANLITGIFAVAASMLAVFSADHNIGLRIVAFGFLGLSQALLMFPWLQLPSVSDSKSGSYRNLGFNMGIGSIIAIVIESLQTPLFYVGFCILPVIANALAVVYWNRSKHVDDAMEDDRPRLSFGETIRANTHFIVFGAMFGLCQYMLSDSIGASGFEDAVTFAVNGAFPLIGLTVSAIVVLIMPVRYFRLQGVFSTQRFGIVFLLAGAFTSLYLAMSEASFTPEVVGTGQYVAQALALAGFNVFDFAFMVTSFAWAARLETDFSTYIGANRAVLYGSIGAGLGLGWLVAHLLPGAPNLPLAIGGFSAVVLCVTTLPFFDDFAPYARIVSSDLRKEHEEKLEAEREAIAEEVRMAEEKERTLRWSARVNSIADEYDLSKREREILFYLARGRNAAFIQQELWISIHTVKTHIANIYRKLEVHSIQEVLDMVEAPGDPIHIPADHSPHPNKED